MITTVGVPVIAPLLATRLNPAGRLLDTTNQVYVGVPPITAKLWL